MYKLTQTIQTAAEKSILDRLQSPHQVIFTKFAVAKIAADDVRSLANTSITSPSIKLLQNNVNLTRPKICKISKIVL